MLLAIGFAVCSGHSVHAQLSQQVMTAIEASRVGNASNGQKALLFMNNDAINKATLNGWIPDESYQAVQRDFAATNSDLARQAAIESNGKFEVQKSTSDTYSPGTDSDYIIELHGDDPVADIRKMQETYNQKVNSHLKEALEAEGLEFKAQDNWHNQLDVDFMADPKSVTDAQFREIAELNNDAYTRRNAAEFERSSRAGDGTRVKPEEFADYAAEMQDFVEKKQDKLSKIRKDPSILANADEMAEFHRLMAQEQKYVSRIESANELLRKQEGLPPLQDKNIASRYQRRLNPDGSMTIRKKPSGTIAERGAKHRSPTEVKQASPAPSPITRSTEPFRIWLSRWLKPR